MSTLLQQLCTPTDTVRMLWTGNNGWLLWDGSNLIGNDLDLTNFRRLSPPLVSAEQIAPHLALHMIGHEHEDHFSQETCRILSEAGSCLFVIPESCRAKAEDTGIPEDRRISVKPGCHFRAAGAEVCCIRAIHGHIGGAVYSGASTLDCGYRFVFGGKTFYQPGDTLLLEEHQSMETIDVLFLSPTEHNMHVDRAVQLIHLLKPKQIFVQHFGTYHETPANRFWSHGYVQELLDALSPEERSKVLVPTQSVFFTLD